LTVQIDTDQAASVDDLKIDPITGLGDDERLVTKFIVYPNPAKTEITVNLKSFDTGSPVNVTVFDSSGRLMSNSSGAGGESLSLDVSGFARSLYLIRAVQNGTTFTCVFVKE